MKVRFTPAGRRQFLDVIAYVLRENPGAARRLKERAQTVLRRLERFPESGRVIPEFADFPYREVIVGSYRFFYRVADKTVWVVAVWHGARSQSSRGLTANFTLGMTGRECADAVGFQT